MSDGWRDLRPQRSCVVQHHGPGSFVNASVGVDGHVVVDKCFGDPQTSPQHADPHGFLAWFSLKRPQVGVLWAGLRVAMWIT